MRPRIMAALLALGLAGCQTVGHGPETGEAQSLLRVAEQAHQSGNEEAAFDLYQKVAMALPTESRAFAGLGASALAIGRYDAAVPAFETLARLEPGRAEPYEGLGRAQLGQRNKPAAIAAIDRGLGQGLRSSLMLNTKGVALDLMNRHAEAQACYRQALNDAPDEPRTLNNLALSLAASRDYTGSLALLRRLADDPVATARTRENLALVLALSGDERGARSAAAHDLAPQQVSQTIRFAEVARAASL